MIRIISTVIVFLSLAIMAAPACAADRAREAGLTPHKALYEISLAEMKSGSQIVNVSGRMLYEWYPACEAWISNHRFDLNYDYADRPMLKMTSNYATYESFDGKRLDFNAQRKHNGDMIELFRGHAQGGENAKSVYSIPEGLEVNLPQGTFFPVGHTLEVLKALKAGEKFIRADVFDGSDDKGAVMVNAFIGPEAAPAAAQKENAQIDQALLAAPAHKLRLAFFPHHKEEAASDYEISLDFHENGVISDMYVEYDDFSVRQKLVALEKLDDMCAQPKKIKEYTWKSFLKNLFW